MDSTDQVMPGRPSPGSAGSASSGGWCLDAAWALAIAGALAVIFWQQRSLTRLALSRPPAPPAGAALAAAEQRVEDLEQQLARGSSAAAAHPAAAIMRAESVRQLQLKVEAARSRESVDSAYGPLIRALGLDAITAERFEGRLVQERLAARDALAAAQAQGVRSIPGYKAAVEEAISQDDEEIGNLLTPAGFAQFDAYRQTLPEQQTVARLAERLASSPTPLSDDQQAQLVQLIDRMEPPVYKQNQSFLSLIGTDAAPLTPAMVNASPGILSPPQIAALQEAETAWMAKAQLQTALRARKSGAAAPSSP
jgi:hypothetical protein